MFLLLCDEDIFKTHLCVLRICSSLRPNSTALWIYVIPDGISRFSVAVLLHIPANTRHRPNVALMLARRLRRRSTIKATLGQCLVFAGMLSGYIWVQGLDNMSNKTRCGSLLQTPQDNLLLLSLTGRQKQGPPKHLFKITSLTANIHVWVSGGFIWCSPTLYCPYTVIDEISTNI